MAFINSDCRGGGEYCASLKDQISSQLSLLPAQAEKQRVSMLLIHGLFVQSCKLQNTLIRVLSCHWFI